MLNKYLTIYSDLYLKQEKNYILCNFAHKNKTLFYGYVNIISAQQDKNMN